MNPFSALAERFHSRFGAAARLFRAPGRVNLIGEHTDYNDGFVMPAAIQFSCYVAGASRDDRILTVHSENMDESVTVNLDRAEPSGGWSDYVVGAAIVPDRNGKRFRGANLLIHSDVPMGAGLSSSAAIEVSVALAMHSLSGYEVDWKQLALWCQKAENEFAGMRCGIMDQFVSCNGEADHVLKLDCRSLGYEQLPISDDVELVICNTMVRHKLAGGEYNIRRQQCEEGVHKLSAVLPEIRALRDVNLQELQRSVDLLDPVVYRRCRHVISENERVQRAGEALAAADIVRFGELMNASHESLRLDFEVSCAELDKMVEIARLQRGVLGARMTGGGFGGCTVNLVSAEDVAEFEENVSAAYLEATGLLPEIYVCRASQGAGEVEVQTATEAESQSR